MALYKEYFKLATKYTEEYGEKTILLMQVGAFFEVYGVPDIANYDKLLKFSQICELCITITNFSFEKNPIFFTGFKDFMIEKYLKKISNAGYTAVVYKQDEQSDTNEGKTRSLLGIFSPGTYFQPDSQELSNSITCVWIDLIENHYIMKGKYVVVGTANIDIYTGKTDIFEFKEMYINNPTTYDNLERFISIYNPNEIILISNFPDEKELDYVISYAGISSNLIHKLNTNTIKNDIILTRIKNCQKQPYQKEILSKYYKFDNFEIFIQNFYKNNIATQAFCYLLDFVYLHNPHLVNKIAEPVFENCSSQLILANHSLKQLNIINDGTVKKSRLSSVSDLLNKCSTAMGERKFKYIILNPTFDESSLQLEYDLTEYFLNNYTKLNDPLKNKLVGIHDLSKYERQIFLRKMTPKDFYKLYNSILLVKEIYDFVKDDNVIINYLLNFNVNFNCVGKLCDELSSFINAHLIIETCNDIDILRGFDTNFIRNGIDDELDKMTSSLSESEQRLEKIREYLNRMIEFADKKKGSMKEVEYVKYHETEKTNIGLISTARRCKLLKDALPLVNMLVDLGNSFQFIISKDKFDFEKQSSANNYIVNDQISNTCKVISSIKNSLKDTITSIYNRFVENFGINYQTHLELIIGFVTLIDVIHTKSIIAKEFNYCKPTIVKEAKKSFVDATGLRHCLIEQFQTNELYVSNDISLGDGITNGILLYGTNAVGKTTIIRALGVSIILAQAGLYVPCTEFRYKPYKQIFTRIIGNDNIFKGLSTFEVEMSELRTILRLTNENSLILGDELCSGTETKSAIGLFVAGIVKLNAFNSSFIFATHMHEIVRYDEITSLKHVHLKHMSVIYDKMQDMLIYDRKLRDGSGSDAYGLEVCKSLNLPQDFLEMANDIRLKYSPECNSILSLKQSRYNTNKIVNLCEKCGENIGTEVHHLQHQTDANEDGIIKMENGVFHKNNLANLMTICEKCHNELHKKDTKLKRVKTTKGSKFVETH